MGKSTTDDESKAFYKAFTKLENIGFEFSTTKQSQRDQRWLQNYREAEKFYKKHGHLQVQMGGTPHEKLRQ